MQPISLDPHASGRALACRATPLRRAALGVRTREGPLAVLAHRGLVVVSGDAARLAQRADGANAASLAPDVHRCTFTLVGSTSQDFILVAKNQDGTVGIHNAALAHRPKHPAGELPMTSATGQVNDSLFIPLARLPRDYRTAARRWPRNS